MTWLELGPMINDDGQMGGDTQIGAAPSRRFIHSVLPGRVVDMSAYPIRGDGSDPMPAEDAPIHVQVQFNYVICRDLSDPGGTEMWADVRYDEPVHGPFRSLKAAERRARAIVVGFVPDPFLWDGDPAYDDYACTENHRRTACSPSHTDDCPYV